MKYGFNAITDEAREKMEELSIRHKRQAPPAHGWDVYTEDVDLQQEELRERFPNLEALGALSPDINRAVTAQRSRHWKNKTTGHYYYLWKEWVFKGERRVTLDHSTTPATQFDRLILDSIPGYDQDRWRDLLLSYPRNSDTAEGGVLI